MSRLIVLKLGGSVLTGEEAVPGAAREVLAWVDRGFRVVAVVSAFEGRTDALLARAARFGPDPWAAAALVATGELESAAVLTLALRAVGCLAATLDAAAIGLRTSAEPLDASVRDADTDALLSALRSESVLVIPGFLGRDPRGRATLLGRGGSDLTALFLAARLGARCRLVKDVPGLFELDPKRCPGARLFSLLSWEGALRLDGGIVQHKGVRFARDNKLEFEVGAIGAAFATRVGPFEPEFATPFASLAEGVPA